MTIRQSKCQRQKIVYYVSQDNLVLRDLGELIKYVQHVVKKMKNRSIYANNASTDTIHLKMFSFLRNIKRKQGN